VFIIMLQLRFMLSGPCILNYMNDNKHDALFIFSLLSYHTSTVSDVSAAHLQEAECIYLANGTCYTVQCNKCHLPHIYILPPEDGLLIRPKHVEV
jgi:hypothetical protein